MGRKGKQQVLDTHPVKSRDALLPKDDAERSEDIAVRFVVHRQPRSHCLQREHRQRRRHS